MKEIIIWFQLCFFPEEENKITKAQNTHHQQILKLVLQL